MLVLLFAMSLTAGSDPVADLVERAQAKLGVSDCTDSVRCVQAAEFRVSSDDDNMPGIDSKDRAFADNGSYCGVVGDKQCLSNPRFRLHAALPGQGADGQIRMSPILPNH